MIDPVRVRISVFTIWSTRSFIGPLELVQFHFHREIAKSRPAPVPLLPRFGRDKIEECGPPLYGPDDVPSS